MFGLLESVTKATIGVATLPLDIVADAVTLGGSLSDQEKPYTAQKIESVFDNVKNATEPEKR